MKSHGRLTCVVGPLSRGSRVYVAFPGAFSSETKIGQSLPIKEGAVERSIAIVGFASKNAQN